MPDIPDDVIEAAARDARAGDPGSLSGWADVAIERWMRCYLGRLSTATVAALARAHGLRVADDDEVVVHKKLFASLKAFRDIIEAGLLDEPTAAMKKWLDLLAAAERQERNDEAE